MEEVEAISNADKQLSLLINGFVGTVPFLDKVAQWVVSDYLTPIALALLLIVMWFIERDRDERLRQQLGVFVALTSLALSNFVVFVINMYYFRPRPFVDLDIELLFYKPTDSSFPSNSVAAVFGIAFGVWSVNRKLGWMAIGAASLYALARVYSGVHYPLDALAGAAIAAGVTFVVFRMRDLLMPILVGAIRVARALRLA